MQELQNDVNRLNDAVFGSRDNPTEQPGLIAEHRSMRMVQERTNEILTELKNAVLWINGLIVLGFITALAGLVFKGIGG